MVLGEDAAALGGTNADSDFLSLSSTEHCGKMKALDQLLTIWRSQGDKVLVFSHSTRMLDIIEKAVIRKAYTYNRLDGATGQRERQVYSLSPSASIRPSHPVK
eukprot:738070-Prorocentrum_minimum.AAC.2